MRRTRFALAVALVGVMAIGATDVSPSELAELAESADVAQLADVTSVDGVPVDMARILADGDPAERADHVARLLGTEAGGPEVPFVGGPGDVAAASLAQTVLERSKYDVPAESAFDRFLAQAQAWLAELLGRAIAALGGTRNAALVAMLVVAAAGIGGFGFLARRRSASIEATADLARILTEGGDPSEYERLAALADSEGRFEDSIRYRFVAGLLRLDLTGRITFRPGLTTGQVVDELDDERFTRLAREFEEIAYGGREATEAMRDRSVDGWRAVLSAPVPT